MGIQRRTLRFGLILVVALFFGVGIWGLWPRTWQAEQIAEKIRVGMTRKEVSDTGFHVLITQGNSYPRTLPDGSTLCVQFSTEPYRVVSVHVLPGEFSFRRTLGRALPFLPWLMPLPDPQRQLPIPLLPTADMPLQPQ